MPKHHTTTSCCWEKSLQLNLLSCWGRSTRVNNGRLDMPRVWISVKVVACAGPKIENKVARFYYKIIFSGGTVSMKLMLFLRTCTLLGIPLEFVDSVISTIFLEGKETFGSVEVRSFEMRCHVIAWAVPDIFRNHSPWSVHGLLDLEDEGTVVLQYNRNILPNNAVPC
jgi:hypothetical protein